MAQYKICQLKDNKIVKIDIFNGNTSYPSTNITELFSTTPTIFDGIFDSEEIENITSNAIPTFFHPNLINIDDTIETIKKKINS